jgi:hypothetical protein
MSVVPGAHCHDPECLQLRPSLELCFGHHPNELITFFEAIVLSSNGTAA